MGPVVLRKTLSLVLPVLIPSWRFFKSVEPSPRVEYRLWLGGVAGDWHPFGDVPERVSPLQMLGRMFWNVQRNRQLYVVSLCERLAENRSDHALWELLRRIAQSLDGQSGDLQFRLIFVDRQDGQLCRVVDYECVPVPLSELRA